MAKSINRGRMNKAEAQAPESAAPVATVQAEAPAPEAQAQTAEAPESAAPEAEAAVVTEAKAAEAEAQASAEKAEAEARKQAADTLRALVRSYKQGERDYRKALLIAGKLAHDYVVKRMALKDTREAAVQTIAGRLAEECCSKVDVNRLIRAHFAWELLAPNAEADKALAAALDALPYRTLRDAWSQLVARENGATAQESYSLPIGMEADCRAAFAEAAKAKVSKEAAEKRVRELLADHAQRERKAAQEKAEAKAAEAKAEGQKAEAAQAEAKAAQTAEAKAEAEAKAKAAQEAEAKAKAEAAKAEAEAKAKAEAEAKAQERLNGKANPPAQTATAEAAQGSKSTAERATSAENLIPSPENASPKDWAGHIVEFLFEHAEPCTVLEHVFAMLSARKGDLDKATGHAIDAANVAYRNAQTRNGKPTAPALATSAA
jgi:hypothetical protein